jgi:hypothetical protein
MTAENVQSVKQRQIQRLEQQNQKHQDLKKRLQRKQQGKRLQRKQQALEQKRQTINKKTVVNNFYYSPQLFNENLNIGSIS